MAKSYTEAHGGIHPYQPEKSGPILPHDPNFDIALPSSYLRTSFGPRPLVPIIQDMNRHIYKLAPSTEDGSYNDDEVYRPGEKPGYNPLRHARLRNCAAMVYRALALSAPKNVVSVTPARVHLDTRTVWVHD